MKMGNKKGFTLIELLAVITIMGILMLVAIPAVSRTIENSRKDTFIDTVKKYVNAAQTMWTADNLQCGDFTSSAVATGYYYVEINSANSSVPQLLEKGGKSPWGNRDMVGFILIHVYDESVNAGVDGILGNSDDTYTRQVDYYPVITDGVHSNSKAVGSEYNISNRIPYGIIKKSEELKRGDVKMTGAAYWRIGNFPAGSSDLSQFVIHTPCYDEDNSNGCLVTKEKAIKCVEA